MLSSACLITCSALCLAFISVQLKRKTRWRMPPGPAPGIFGDNRWNVPFYQPWKRYTEWHKTFGMCSTLDPFDIVKEAAPCCRRRHFLLAGRDTNHRYVPRLSVLDQIYQGRPPLVVLGSLKAATDILDKRGNIYSSRPRNIMGLVLQSIL